MRDNLRAQSYVSMVTTVDQPDSLCKDVNIAQFVAHFQSYRMRNQKAVLVEHLCN